MSLTRGRPPKIVVCLILFFGTLLLYAPVVKFDFVTFDDFLYVVNNAHVNRGLVPGGLAWCFTTGYASTWHPLTWMSHMLDCQLFGLNPAGPHVVNVLFHALNSVLLFWLLLAMTGAVWRSAMVAALFAWHPMHVESVAWITERKDVLSAFFGLLSIGAYVRYARSKGAASPAAITTPAPEPGASSATTPPAHFSAVVRAYAASLVFFALALMSKPMMVTLPGLLLLLDFWPLRRVVPAQSAAVPEGRPARDQWIGLLIEKLPFIGLSVFASVLTVLAPIHSGNAQLLAIRPPLLWRAANVVLSYCHYLEKLFWPENLAARYPLETNLSSVAAVLGALFLIVITEAAVRRRKQEPYFLAGWLWFLGTLVPVIGFIQIGVQGIADRYTYLSAVGLFLVVSWGAYDLAHRCRLWPPLAVALAGAVACAGVILSGRQLQYWRDGGTLALRAIQVTANNHVAHVIYATYLLNHQQLDKARAEFEEALRIDPYDASSRVELGRLLYILGRPEEAANHLRQALRLHPQEANAAYFLGKILFDSHQPAQAAEQFSRELQIAPGNPLAHCELGRALAQQGHWDAALAQFHESIRLLPGYADAHWRLASLLARQGKTQEAVAQYRIALQILPDNPELLNDLAWLLATGPDGKYRDGAEALRLASRACQLTAGKRPRLTGTLAAAYAEAGHFEQAIAIAQQAHDLAAAQKDATYVPLSTQLLECLRSYRSYHDISLGRGTAE